MNMSSSSEAFPSQGNGKGAHTLVTLWACCVDNHFMSIARLFLSARTSLARPGASSRLKFNFSASEVTPIMY